MSEWTRLGQQTVPWTSSLIIVMTISRSLLSFLEGIVFSLSSLATIFYLGKERVKYGTYYMWRHVGTTTLIVSAAICAWAIKIEICGHEGFGYFISFILASFFLLLSLLSLPYFEYKYETGHTVNWKEVKSVIFNGHYVYMLMMTFYLGACAAFQIFWEFWYLDGLKADPLIMGLAALIRRPILALFLFISSYVIKKIGDLNTMCVSLLLFVVAFLALSFTRLYWYVLLIDTFQSSAYGLGKSAFLVHFSKAGSKSSSGTIIGKFLRKFRYLTKRSSDFRRLNT